MCEQTNTSAGILPHPRAEELNVVVRGGFLANEGIQDGDYLIVYPDQPIEDGGLYAYKLGYSPTIHAGRLHLLPGLYSLTDNLRERCCPRSEVAIVGRIRGSFGPIKEL